VGLPVPISELAALKAAVRAVERRSVLARMVGLRILALGSRRPGIGRQWNARKDVQTLGPRWFPPVDFLATAYRVIPCLASPRRHAWGCPATVC